MERMLACRVGDLDLLLPFEGMERLVPWFDVEYSGDRVRWGDEEIPFIRLDECLGFPGQDPALDAGIAILQIHDETMALLADRFLGLVEVDPEFSFRVPLNWVLGHPGLPYRAFHMVEDRMVPEVAPFHLLVRDPWEEDWPVVRGKIQDAPGRYLAVTVDGISAAVPLEAVEHVVDSEVLIRLPGLPKTILGILQLQGRPIPVAPPLPNSTSAVAIVVLRCSGGLFGLTVDDTHGMVELSSQEEDQEQEADQETPPLLGGCDLLALDPLGNTAFTLDPERIWAALG
ncbi:MAG: chemotaxis protein CheW [Acidobacteriota bacterium]